MAFRLRALDPHHLVVLDVADLVALVWDAFYRVLFGNLIHLRYKLFDLGL